MLKSLYHKTMGLAAHRHAAWALGFVAFIESSIFPIPPDILLIPMVLAEKAKAWFFATLATLASVLGGMAGYAIGFFLFAAVGQPLLAFYGYHQAFTDFAGRYNEYGAWVVFIAGVTPFPYKVITIASGATKLDFLVFVVASFGARGLRFFIVAGLLFWFGPPIRQFIERYLGPLFALFVLLLVAGFILLEYLR